VRYRKGWIALIVLAVLSPLGLLAIGGAWGEWDLDTIREIAGYAPEGMQKTEDSKPEAPLPDYEVPGLAGGWWQSALGTVISALIGGAATAVCVVIIGRLVKHGRIS
jgi:cobalt/nickel transport protein